MLHAMITWRAVMNTRNEKGQEAQSLEATHPRSLSARLGIIRARRRFVLAAVIAVVTALSMHGYGPAVSTVAGWDAGSAVLLGTTWWVIMISGPRQTRRRAAVQDPGGTAIWVIVLLASVISLFSAAGLLRSARQFVDAPRVLLLSALCLTAVALSWMLTHTAYALRYAHLYYRQDDEGEGGLTFPGNQPPDDWDFAYFAFTLGMCFQVSDVCITSRTIRRYVLIHAVLSFAYNTAIVALALNIAFGLLG
jgi:uncharacterized membrane protein